MAQSGNQLPKRDGQQPPSYPSVVSPEVARANNGLKDQLDRGAKRRLKD